MRGKSNRGARTRFLRILTAGATVAILFTVSLTAQQPAAPSSTPAASAPAADLNQLMRGLFFPNSNVVFFTQVHDPTEVKAAPAPSAATDPLSSVFGNWQAVENSALTIADAADLLMTPGRKCSNGKDVPLSKPDWVQLVNQLREAGIVAYKAALTKDQDKMIQASEVLNTSCANCHGKYRARVRCQ
jgi:hypothetical protein